MKSKTIIIFFALSVLMFVEGAKPTDKHSVEKEKRGLAGLGDNGFNPWSAFPGLDSSSFDTKGLSAYSLPENKFPSPLNPVFNIPDPEAYRFEESALLKTQPLAFPQNYESLLLTPEFQSLRLPQTYQPLGLPQSEQPWAFPQENQHLTLSQASQSWGLPQSEQSWALPQTSQSFALPQTYQSLELSQNNQPSIQYFKAEVKEVSKPIVEDRQE